MNGRVATHKRVSSSLYSVIGIGLTPARCLYCSRRVDALEESAALGERWHDQDKAFKDLARSARCVSQALPGTVQDVHIPPMQHESTWTPYSTVLWNNVSLVLVMTENAQSTRSKSGLASPTTGIRSQKLCTLAAVSRNQN